MSTYELLAELPLQSRDTSWKPTQVAFSSEFERKTTVIRLRGAGEEGLGEDVTYDAVDQEILQRAGAGRCRSRAASRSPPSPSTCARWSSSRSRPPARGFALLPQLGV